MALWVSETADLRWSALYLAVVILLCLITALVSGGYRAVRDEEYERLVATDWFHYTRESAAPGEALDLDPSRCRKLSRVYRCDRLARRLPAVYFVLAVIDPVVRRANGIPTTATLTRTKFTVDGRPLREHVLVRHTGEIAVVNQTVRVYAVASNGCF
ncbi:hypothetical protein [Luteimicrobium sp. DT211]|uniref:hypothetical protein n=1 Tax=Luteimicrobium sp. DT211 TaxID=3393412 RepID=UPI003CFBB529